MDHLDFELRITTEGDRLRVEVLKSPAGQAHALTSLPPLGEQLTLLQNAPRTYRSRSHRDIRRRPVGEEAAPGAVLDTVKGFGATLFEAVMTGEVLGRYRSSLDRAREAKKGLRLRLRIDAPELSRHPWEFLYDPAELDYPCLSTDTPIIRNLEIGRATESLGVEPPLRVLGMVASPENLPQLDVQQEKLNVERAVEHLVEKGAVSLHWLEGQSWRSLVSSFSDYCSSATA